MPDPITFKIEQKIKGAFGRAGTLATPHGVLLTPAFVIVGTKATVKSLTTDQLKKLGATIVLANTYHLYLQPGDEIVRDAGGLHAFMNWHGPAMTDSGGFQVFSLGSAFTRNLNKFISRGELEAFVRGKIPEQTKDPLATIKEGGVVFKSHGDGSTHTLTPEKSIQIQNNIGADIIFAFDECTSPIDSYDYQKEAMERTHRWADRSLATHQSNPSMREKQGLFGIVQGGHYEDLRKQSATYIANLDVAGFGIGGSYTKEDMEDVLKWVNPLLPEKKPRHLLGIGEPLQLFIGVEHGVDTFDCVAPTREARNGAIYTRDGRINLFNAKYKNDFSSLEKDCGCYTCEHYTCAYMAHLFRAKEILGYTLATIHNLHFFVTLMTNIRLSILENRFLEFKDSFASRYYHFNP
ncbi:MAG: tRNA-guanine transglycosylase [Parcubacteria group bacterium Greene0416_14]|nr:MAG: tRNA-guanine transglycosylase [Parcubacteria group bacterium Greene0416_14]TSD01609.1 MAG: tRNA-guanine transglycosylase [Parcubacteria group bacterium Greene1014_15]TSD08342.1 MAG: tRNA-guanine transglycosylase [Parcubacteria group bacterium Greene0714_4]